MLWGLFAIDPQRLATWERALLRVALAVGAFMFAWTFLEIQLYAGVDLRNRVVGARVMLAGYDPYTFAWESGMPEEWLDPVHDPKAHRLTISPPTLLPYATIADLPYRTQRFVHFAAEWLALIASLALLVRVLPDDRMRAALLIGATLFVIATDVWRLHIERGQIYVFHLLALSVALYASRGGSADSFAAGIALGVLGLMRPNLLVFAPALLLLRQWRAGTSLCATAGIGVAVTLAYVPESSWQSYLDVGEQYYRAIEDPESVPDRPRPDWDGEVEGVDFKRALPGIASSSFAVLLRTLHDHWNLPMLEVEMTSKLVLIALAASLLALCWRRDPRTGFAIALVLALDTEFFLPHRWGYADVMLLAPVALLLPRLIQSPFALSVVAMGLIGGLLGAPLFGMYTATLVRSWLVMGGLTALALHPAAFRLRA